MSCGLPVVAARAGCLPEIYGRAAYYFPPGNSDDLLAAINRLLADSNLRQTLRQAGYRQVEQYSWSKTAQQTLNLYLTA